MRYKIGDVLITKSNTILTIDSIDKVSFSKDYHKYFYKMKESEDIRYWVDYVDNAKHVKLASNVAKLLLKGVV